MEEVKGKKNIYYFIGLISGILSIISCFIVIGFAVSNKYFSIYTLSIALILLGVNRIGLHLSNFKQNMFENIFLTVFIFVLALLVGFTKYSIYFLVTSMFLYSLTIIISRLLNIKKDHSVQSIIFNVLCMVFSFLFSFVFFFPAIYAKHGTSVSNSNFIVFCYVAMIIVSSSKNLLFPYHNVLKINVIVKIIKKTMVYEIILTMLILVVLCSVYFTVVEQNITSYADALWFCFSVITTIGFGDVYVTTTFGRILSVILGVSGIIVVAVFTSVIVNFYNEISKKRENKKSEQLTEEVERNEEEEKNQ